MFHLKVSAMSNAVNAASMSFAVAVPDDDLVLRTATIRGVVCLTAGNLVATNSAGVDVTFPLTAGQFLPIKPSKIKAATTGTYAVLQ